MANYLSDRTGASIDAVLDNADAGNIGKQAMPSVSADLDTLTKSGFYYTLNSAPNSPKVQNATVTVNAVSASNTVQCWMSHVADEFYFRRKNGGSWSAWQELYHTGNTGATAYSSAAPSAGEEVINFRGNFGLIDIARAGISANECLAFINDNGKVGSISTDGTATSYSTSSDPRLKDFASAPSDSDINAEFNAVFSCFRTFKWKSNPTGDLVWGFDAHACIDAGTDIGSEGEGSRSLNIGDVYETIPAVTENRVVMDSDGNPTTQIEEVVVTPAIDKKVTPAGVDQSKVVPILLAKIEQLERRLTAAGL